MNVFQKIRHHLLLIGIISLILGVILFVHPSFALGTLCNIIGTFLIIIGVIWIGMFWMQYKRFVPMMIVGIVILVIGIYTLLYPERMIKVINLIFVFFIICHSLQAFYQAKILYKMKDPNSRVVALIGGITVCLALLILWNPFASMNALIMMIGASFVLNGLSSLWIAFQYR